ncbi:LacI family DNA-binding transcriptional regulator [Vibrio sp. TH_r3]|uniref:LacI family DNA-binding transcriptional regulator n=1 Tax=unclassified Vibrio TaxID=2614977 RepID=UPI0029557008|nr:LacI family DNA-binding transcriptional regulator [Vibrio sp. TH_r3]MDV7105586.1 LacI family DNA-binding transcriptional regulator [Vibrio sp. TH_r3]
MRTKNKKPTQADVAKLAKVSPAVVSAVINGNVSENIRVGDVTRLRVLEAVKKLGYVPNMVARSLAGGKKNIVGLFSYEPVFPKEQNDFFRDFLLGVEKAAEAHSYDLLLHTSSKVRNNKKSVYEKGVNRLKLADGSILFGREPDKKELKSLISENYDFVYIGRQEVDNVPISYVAANYQESTQIVAESIFKHGHRQFIYIGNESLSEPSVDRELGYRAFAMQLSDFDIEASIIRGDAAQITLPMVQEWLQSGVTAALIEEPDTAEYLYSTLQKMGISVPTDFSIALLGESMQREASSIDWSGFELPKQEMGYQAFILLMQKIDSNFLGSKVQVTLPCNIRVGSTIGPRSTPKLYNNK